MSIEFQKANIWKKITLAISLTAIFVSIGLASTFAQANKTTKRQAQNGKPPNIRSHQDIEYARVGNHKLLLDLYLPKKTEKPLPVVMWVHGGGWIGGSKKWCPAARMVAKGYAASINYRLSPVGTCGNASTGEG